MLLRRWSRQVVMVLGIASMAILSGALPGSNCRGADPDKTGRGGAQAQEPRLNLSYRRVPLERVLDYISRASRGINIKVSVDDPAIEEELRRSLVTIELSNVTWRTAVEYLANKYKYVLNFEQEDNGVVLLERPPRITMSVQEAPIESVIKLIASESKANIIIGPDVKGNVTFNIHDVPWKEALESILKTQGYIKVEEDNGIIRITTPERVKAQQDVIAVALKYIQPEGSRFSPVVDSEYVQRISQTSGSDTDFSLLGVLNQIKSPEGSISYERRTNTIIMKDTATNIQSMLGVIEQIDRVPLQVKIAVRILSHSLDGEKQLGVNWTEGITGALESGSSYATTFPFSADNFGDLGLDSLSAMAQGVDGPVALSDAWMQHLDVGEDEIPGTYDDEVDTSVQDYSETYNLGSVSFASMQAILQILQTSDEVQLIQAPEIVALDNQEATIHVGEVIRYAEFYTETTDGGTVSGYREATPLVAGVQLIVVPHINGQDGNIILEVVPKTEDFDGFETFGEGTENELRLPQTSTKVVVTKMRLKNKETGVIAGLMTNQDIYAQTKVPLLGDIPILGYLFKRDSHTSAKNNMLIFITPTILQPSDTEDFLDELESVRDMVNANEGPVGYNLKSAFDDMECDTCSQKAAVKPCNTCNTSIFR